MNIMKKSDLKRIPSVIALIVMISCGYSLFYNKAFSGYDIQGKYIWLSASTVNFVNNWLKEGPVNLRFIMYEFPASIEFTGYAQRSAYISYPPGAMLPVYILAKVLNKAEIQVSFVKYFLILKFLLDTILVGLIFYSIFMIVLVEKRRNWALFASLVFALGWMLLPINLYYLRNVYFSDHCVITVVLFFTLLEICGEHFSKKSLFFRCLYACFMFFIALYGVLTDYYFLFVLFIAWLAKIIPMFKNKTSVRSIFASSLPYVLPVFSGLFLFWTQISTVPHYQEIILGRMQHRMFDGPDFTGNKLVSIMCFFIRDYSFIGVVVLVLLFVLFLFLLKKNNKLLFVKYRSLIRIFLIICIPPVLQVIALKQHSVVHEFSMLKFGLPVVFAVLISTLLVMELTKCLHSNIVINIENNGHIKNAGIPLFYIVSIVTLIVLVASLNQNTYYFKLRIDEEISSYDREYLIKNNYNFNDVYFSFTESVEANPPYYLAISKKAIYKINASSEISERFPNLDGKARVLLLVNKNNGNKSELLLETENRLISHSPLVFFSENFSVYQISQF
jgi:hypothetical protein